ncbi:hypothetical protein DMC30DRAFT_391458 [Rhodotorula diobovata]|uniref:Uncharacterized protein n=1 Tax=Rhodotorula diobovata TaxID=5288 RepID=A0A5C5G2W7_9BASI|nr:hypothetical protein DMC30DRAFT_391458 [Rhodotorula diobovata]
MSFDRKNKRAAQQALRDAQASADGSGLVTATHATAQSPRVGGDGSGLVQTLRQSVDLGGGARLNDYALYQQVAAQQQYTAAHPGSTRGGDVEAAFGSPDSVGYHRASPSSPPVQHRSLQPHDSPHAPLHFATLSQGPTATFIAPASSGLSHHFGGGAAASSNGRSSVAAQAMLSEQARRLSSTSESLSPPRMAHMSRARVSFNNGVPSASGASAAASPPLAVPGSGAGAGSGSIFGTSPFSGSRGLFIPSSYDSNEDGGGFPRSPPVRPSMLGEAQRSSGSAGMMTLGAPWQDAIADEFDDAGDEATGEDFDEGFLPSSLNDLLTDEEIVRRTRRANGGAGGGAPSSLSNSSPLAPAFDPFLNSKSVPADLFLATGKPSLAPPSAVPVPHPSLGARSASHTAATSFGLLSSSVEGHNPSAAPYQPAGGSLLAQSRAREATIVPDSPAVSATTATPPTASLLGAALNGHPTSPASAAGIYSASFSDAALHRPASFAAAAASANSATSGGAGAGASTSAQHPPPRYPQSGLSPGTNASLALPGSSLPGGLAAGLSRLHLVPPAHTGETPPSGSYAAAAAAAGGASPGRAAMVGSPLARGSGSPRLGVPGQGGRPGAGGSSSGGGGGAGTPEPQSAVTERPPRVGGGAHGASAEGSAEGSAAEDEDEGVEGAEAEVEETQFDMEVA